MKESLVFSIPSNETVSHLETENRLCVEKFTLLKSKTLELQEILKSSGIHVEVSETPFKKLVGKDSQFLDLILRNLDTRVEIIRSAITQDISLDDNKGLFWVACRRFNLRPDNETIERIRDEDVMEIYNMDVVQTFSNFKFWNLCSYPIDQILTEEFYALFERPGTITEGIMSTFGKVLQSRKLSDYQLPDHIVKELYSTKNYQFKVQNNFLAPLFDRADGSVAAVISTLKAERIEN